MQIHFPDSIKHWQRLSNCGWSTAGILVTRFIEYSVFWVKKFRAHFSSTNEMDRFVPCTWLCWVVCYCVCKIYIVNLQFDSVHSICRFDFNMKIARLCLRMLFSMQISIIWCDNNDMVGCYSVLKWYNRIASNQVVKSTFSILEQETSLSSL